MRTPKMQKPPSKPSGTMAIHGGKAMIQHGLPLKGGRGKPKGR